MVTTSDGTSLLRRACGSSIRTWVSGWGVVAALVAATALLEALFMRGDTWQYLATILLAYFLVVAWAVAGAVVGVASLLRKRFAMVEPITNALLLGAIGIALLLWTWFAITTASTRGL